MTQYPVIQLAPPLMTEIANGFQGGFPFFIDPIGSHRIVDISDGDDEAEEYDIVGRTEADPINGKISDESPVGHALLGKAVGEKAEVLLPSGQTVEYEVLAITHAAN